MAILQEDDKTGMRFAWQMYYPAHESASTFVTALPAKALRRSSEVSVVRVEIVAA